MQIISVKIKSGGHPDKMRITEHESLVEAGKVVQHIMNTISFHDRTHHTKIECTFSDGFVDGVYIDTFRGFNDSIYPIHFLLKELALLDDKYYNQNGILQKRLKQLYAESQRDKANLKVKDEPDQNYLFQNQTIEILPLPVEIQLAEEEALLESERAKKEREQIDEDEYFDELYQQYEDRMAEQADALERYYFPS